MKNFWLIAAACVSIAGPVLADDADSPYKPFIVLDSSSERDTLANQYVAANITIGVKAANKVEYSIKSGISLKDAASGGSDSISSNIEGKIKKSYDIGTFFTPYVAFRLGQKIKSDATSFTHYAFDAGLKIPMTTSTALDVGVRHRDAFDSDEQFKSFRVHTTLLWDVNPSNTLGLRWTKSNASYDGVATTEERETWRLHWQHNY